MRKQSQQNNKTWIAKTLEHMNAWRSENQWSRESVCEQVVEAHERIDAHVRTAIRFEPKTTDLFSRMKVNADRIYRWLDDASKDTNLISLNFTESLLAAMPSHVALNWLNDLLMPHGYTVRLMQTVEQAEIKPMQIQNMLKENGESASACFALFIDQNKPENLLAVKKELDESIAIQQAILAQVEAKLSNGA